MSEPDSDDFDAMAPAVAVDIRLFSVKCGQCDTYQTISKFARGDDWNVYTYICENQVCDPDVTKTLVEVPIDLDVFARRDPGWGGGKRHAGGDGAGDDTTDPAEGKNPGDGKRADAGGDGVLQVIEYDPFTDD